ncbi:MAG: hypothetical protein IPG50_02190 [Myxococcales bacterium]|nr:hypothetical protein [Myxococcales bacterium]
MLFASACGVLACSQHVKKLPTDDLPYARTVPDAPETPPEPLPAEPTCARTVEHAVFVAEDGADGERCGGRYPQYTSPHDPDWDGPCRTLGWALRKADAKLVVVDGAAIPRNHVEVPVVLRRDVVIEGGWRRKFVLGATAPMSLLAPLRMAVWEKDCPGKGNPKTAISTGPIVAEDVAGTARLIDLELEVAETTPGETSIGVRAVGATTRVELDNVRISASAPMGKKGAKGAAGDAGGDDCPSADGAAATTSGANGADATETGTFSAEGYQARDGQAGADGLPGNAALAGGTGTCVDCVTQCAATTSAGTTTCSVATSLRQCGSQAKSGCGGGGGRGGAGSGGGGSSVALLAWDATVVLNGGSLYAANGGSAASPGVGGPGGAGGTGRAGIADPPVACSTQCEYILGGCTGTQPAAGQGGAGTVGGAGSAGGSGGRGAGGSSYAIVKNAGAAVEYGPTTRLGHGVGGAGSVRGNAADVFVVP